MQQHLEASNIATPLTEEEMNLAIRTWTAEGFNMQEIQRALAATPDVTSKPQVTGAETQGELSSGNAGLGSGNDEGTRELRNAAAQAKAIAAYQQMLEQATQNNRGNPQ